MAESHSKAKEVESGSTPEDATNIMAFLVKMKSELEGKITTSSDEVKADMKRGIDKIKEDNKKLREEMAELDKKFKDVETELATTKRELNTTKVRLTDSVSVTIRQDQVIKECKDKIDYLENVVFSDTIRISGVKEEKEEDVAKTVESFFTDKLKIKANSISLRDVYRVGKGEYRTIVVQLNKSRDKGIIYKNAKNLKDITNEENKSYQIREHLSAKKFAEKQRENQIRGKNSRRTADKLAISFEKRRLKVDGLFYEKAVNPPRCEQLLKPTVQELADRLKIELKSGDVIEVENQQFQAFAADVKTIHEVNIAYAKVCSLNMDGRHVMAVYRLPGKAFHILQDFNDNDEHNSGSFMLQLLEAAKIKNLAVFVVHWYDGTHIGSKRFDAIKSAMDSIIIRNPYNKVLNEHQQPWPKDFAYGNQAESFRGRRGARGGLR